MKILVISLAGIGDTIFATPLIHELRANFPAAVIDAVVLWAGARDVLRGNPHINSLYQRNLISAGATESLAFLRKLRGNRYDFSINTHPQSRIHYRIVARFIGARVRISHQYDNPSVLGHLLVNRTVKQDYNQHAVENNLKLLPLLDAKPVLSTHGYELYPGPLELAWADDFIRSHTLANRTVLAIHVGSGGTKNLALRRWPLEFYLELIKRVVQAFPKTAILLLGGPEEEEDHEKILGQVDKNAVWDVQTPTVIHAAALLKHCQVFLSVDTALMHVAAAMRVPKQIVIETPTWNKPIQPYNQPFVLVTNPAVAGRNLEYYRYDGRGIRGSEEELRACMASVTVDSVYEAVVSAIKAVA
jgi:lipopolysaccharide heptosyltransferase II